LVREENPGAFLPPCPIYHNHDEVTPFILWDICKIWYNAKPKPLYLVVLNPGINFFGFSYVFNFNRQFPVCKKVVSQSTFYN
jgi:hypothetical protein